MPTRRTTPPGPAPLAGLAPAAGRQRLVLHPAARRLWRDPQALQLGRTEGRAVVIEGLDPAARAVLALLDGTRKAPEVLREAKALGCSSERAEELLVLLDGAGLLDEVGGELLVPTPLTSDERARLGPDLLSLGLLRGEGGHEPLRRRHAAGVRVVGAGRVGAAVAGLLVGAGVGSVDVLDGGSVRPADTAAGGSGAADTGRRRDEAAVGAAARISPRASVGTRGRPDLVVLAPVSPAALEEDLSAVPPGVPHLLAEVRETVGVVGPLVVPGSSACLHCLDLERSDRDPAWPALAAQLASPVRGTAPCDSVLAAAVAAQACLQVLAAIDGPASVRPGPAPRAVPWPPATVGGTLELALPDWRWRRRTWPLHPDCDCAAPPAEVDRAG